MPDVPALAPASLDDSRRRSRVYTARRDLCRCRTPAASADGCHPATQKLLLLKRQRSYFAGAEAACAALVGEDYGGSGWSQRWLQIGITNGHKVVKGQGSPSRLALEVSIRTKGCPLVGGDMGGLLKHFLAP
eukprot:scaffold31931_cov112-Isochrysis_galbana.AAC.1